jgi:hypothetical protein
MSPFIFIEIARPAPVGALSRCGGALRSAVARCAGSRAAVARCAGSRNALCGGVLRLGSALHLKR